MANRLIDQTSPYLLQHAHNPVDWYPWGEEALQRAKQEDKPILLSVGYAACHWCHVMERESFEDEATARLMNDRFINIKVDREERPDVDSIYMTAVQAMTGHGGWPMTMFLTPDGKPFYGGTYFPPEPRHGMPSFQQVLEAVHDAWVNRRAEIEQQSGQLVEAIERSVRLGGEAEVNEQTLNAAASQILQQVDDEWGGFGAGMKFPQAPTLEFLLRMHVGHDYPGALDDLTLTLDKMARGGIFDHVAGGFHRYTVDRIWLVPHFEKMLYDNGQLIRLYARAWQATGRDLYRETAIATGEWMIAEMQQPEGGFSSSLDADSEGVEGKFYVWPYEEFIAIAGDDMPLAVAAFAVAGSGNWEGTNVLWRPQTDEEVADQAGTTPQEVRAAVERVVARLHEARATRIRPATDDKVLASWNGLAIAGLAEAGRVLHRPDFVRAAERAAAFVLGTMRPDGRLHRSWRDGSLSGPAFLEDHAMMADACLTLYETTFEQRWFDDAVSLADAMVALFSDPSGAGFFDSGSDAPSTVVRPKDLFDTAMPSGNAAASEVLLRLAALTGEATWHRTATGFLRSIASAVSQAPMGFGATLCAMDRWLSPGHEVALVGSPVEVAPLAEAVRARYRPNLVVAAGPPGTLRPALLQDRPQRDGRPTAYVCRNFACRMPVTSAAELATSFDRE